MALPSTLALPTICPLSTLTKREVRRTWLPDSW